MAWRLMSVQFCGETKEVAQWCRKDRAADNLLVELCEVCKAQPGSYVCHNLKEITFTHLGRIMQKEVNRSYYCKYHKHEEKCCRLLSKKEPAAIG